MFLKNFAFIFFLSLMPYTFSDLRAESNLTPVRSVSCYIPPSDPLVDKAFFHELIYRSHREHESFHTISKFFEQNKGSYYQFEFKYPLKDEEYAKTFTKVLHIKAQQAHRFVYVISESEFIAPCHLGFMRKIRIGTEGLTILEHILVDHPTNSHIFIEELVKTQEEERLGSLAALNRVIEENGLWYFQGTYLYADKPNDDEICDRFEMFNQTYENMRLFIENENVDEIFEQLKKF
jgi:hypothetical protein